MLMRFYRRSAVASVGAVIGLGFLLALSGPGCSPDMPLSGMPPGAPIPGGEDPDACGELTYENFAEAFFSTYCLRCHNENLEGDIARTDAPLGINFNRLELVNEFLNRIRLRAGVLGDMPPTILPVPRPSEEERRQLIEWIDCGAPSENDAAP